MQPLTEVVRQAPDHIVTAHDLHPVELAVPNHGVAVDIASSVFGDHRVVIIHGVAQDNASLSTIWITLQGLDHMLQLVHTIEGAHALAVCSVELGYLLSLAITSYLDNLGVVVPERL